MDIVLVQLVDSRSKVPVTVLYVTQCVRVDLCVCSVCMSPMCMSLCVRRSVCVPRVYVPCVYVLWMNLFFVYVAPCVCPLCVRLLCVCTVCRSVCMPGVYVRSVSMPRGYVPPVRMYVLRVRIKEDTLKTERRTLALCAYEYNTKITDYQLYILIKSI